MVSKIPFDYISNVKRLDVNLFVVTVSLLLQTKYNILLIIDF